jgi:hypothetical protein
MRAASATPRFDRWTAAAHNQLVITDQERARQPFDAAARTEPHAFRAQIDTGFEVEHADGPIPLRLASVSDDVVVSGFLQFSLFFHGPPARLLPQGIYVLRHETLGALALFIVPILGSTRERIVYEACFNRRAVVATQPGERPA